MQVLVLAASKCIIRLPIVVLLEESLQPLAELEVVEWSGFDKLTSLNMSLDAILVKSILEHLVVLDILVLVLGLPSNLAELESSWV